MFLLQALKIDNTGVCENNDRRHKELYIAIAFRQAKYDMKPMSLYMVLYGDGRYFRRHR